MIGWKLDRQKRFSPLFVPRLCRWNVKFCGFWNELKKIIRDGLRSKSVAVIPLMWICLVLSQLNEATASVSIFFASTVCGGLQPTSHTFNRIPLIDDAPPFGSLKLAKIIGKWKNTMTADRYSVYIRDTKLFKFFVSTQKLSYCIGWLECKGKKWKYTFYIRSRTVNDLNRIIAHTVRW